ncbi:MAG: toll-Interleukin receptor [Deltaproteobacteria bacterium]|nr:toll-Interleukin receptor [Deltaproteobacteria bacterium]
MPLLNEKQVRERAQQESVLLRKSYTAMLSETVKFAADKQNDIFLSHSFKDSELIVGVKGILEDLGYSVYVDWIDDPQLDRSNVNRLTAHKLRERMQKSKSLFYVTTANATSSKWMPWECGYFDGVKEKVAILPLRKEYSSSDVYEGQEYLGLYPYCIMAKVEGKNEQRLWIQYDKKHYTSFDIWVDTPDSLINWKE